MSVLIVSALLYSVLFSVLKVTDYAATVLVFSAWCWFAFLAFFTYPWPLESEA
jgi:hypothetical protein